MAKAMKIISAAAISAAICFSVLYSFTNSGLLFTMTVTFGTVAYHFCMRLIIAFACSPEGMVGIMTGDM